MIENAEKALNDAATSGDIALVNSLLDQGADIDGRYNDGTALIMAALMGWPDTVKVLLERGADVDTVDSIGLTALIWAIEFSLEAGDTEGGLAAIRLLLEYGADANHATDLGEMPLFLAAEAGSAEAVRMLLEHGADVNAAMPDGSTALLTAAAGGHCQVAEALLKAGADVNGSAQGWTPLHFAVDNQDVDSVKLFLDAGADIDASNDAGNIPLTLAQEQDNGVMIRLLSESGA